MAANRTSAPHPCSCADDCAALTRRTFAQGHDARLVTRLRNQVLDPAHPMQAQDAMAELQRRGGLDGLSAKLDRALDNAQARAEKGAGAKKTDRRGNRRARAIQRAVEAEKPADLGQTIEGFSMDALPQETRPARARVGRWEYPGEVRTYRSREEGAEKADVFQVFQFSDRRGRPQRTLRYKLQASVPSPKPAPEAPAPEAPLPIGVGNPRPQPGTFSTGFSARARRAADEAREAEAAEPKADFSDIPF